MDNRIVQLRVKIKNLADEAATIRVEEKRAMRKGDGVLYADLREHRRGIVRAEARKALLAYAMLRDVPYRQCEARPAQEPNLAKVRAMAERFGAWRGPAELTPAWTLRWAEQRARFDAWVAEAKKDPAVQAGSSV